MGKTELGRDMLAQDYIFKQLTASLMYPEKELGKKFWERVYSKIYASSPLRGEGRVRGFDIPTDTFNKVWIVADKAKVLERNNAAYVVGAHLKVLLEQDYLAAQENRKEKIEDRQATKNKTTASIASDLSSPVYPLTSIIKEIIIPEIEKEVNQGEHFAQLRQMFYSMILATWYKLALKDALLNQVYSNKGKTSGVLSNDPAVKEKIYNQYLQSFKKGTFDYIKEEYDASSQQIVPRKYFSGGLAPDMGIPKILDRAQIATPSDKVAMSAVGDMAMVQTNMAKVNGLPGAAIIDNALIGDSSNKGKKYNTLTDLKINALNKKLAKFYGNRNRKKSDLNNFMAWLNFISFLVKEKDSSRADSPVHVFDMNDRYWENFYANNNNLQTLLHKFVHFYNFYDANRLIHGLDNDRFMVGNIFIYTNVIEEVQAIFQETETIFLRNAVRQYKGERTQKGVSLPWDDFSHSEIRGYEISKIIKGDGSEAHVLGLASREINGRVRNLLVFERIDYQDFFNILKRLGETNIRQTILEMVDAGKGDNELAEFLQGKIIDMAMIVDNVSQSHQPDAARIQKTPITIMDQNSGNSSVVNPLNGKIESLIINGKERLVPGKGIPLMAFWTGRLPNKIAQFKTLHTTKTADFKSNPLIRSWADSDGVEHGLHGLSQVNLLWTIDEQGKDAKGSFIKMSVDTTLPQYKDLKNDVFGEAKVTFTFWVTESGYDYKWEVENKGKLNPAVVEEDQIIPWSGGLHGFFDAKDEKTKTDRNDWSVRVKAKKYWKLDPKNKIPLLQPAENIGQAQDFNDWVSLKDLKESIEIPFTDLDFDVNDGVVAEFRNNVTGEIMQFKPSREEKNGMLWIPVGMAGLENTMSWQSIPASPSALYLDFHGIDADLVKIKSGQTWSSESSVRFVNKAAAKGDEAMVNGGIDLNAKNMGLDISKEGKGVQMTVDPAMVAEFQKGNFTGVEGIILRIIPIQSPLPIMGL
ncbi:MAG: hypothetical protein HQL26_07460 [Candidatus Omnitrophica bacterium]|nr:hypothetical protein [Candidatus Omnitrophota bacterium]